ncbi:MAG: hypothetical protein EBZ20_07010 [Rhodobacteraceae bacterium]|nr:hypothetical protein [Paracoccaceae bacterium]
MYKRRSLAMADVKQWGLPIGGASGSVSAWNMLTYRVLLMTFWAVAFLLPSLLLASAYMLKAYAAVFGKELRFGPKNKDTA